MQTSAKKACFQFVECSFSYAEDTTFPCNFQGFREKILEKGEEKEKKQAAPGIESRLLILSLFDEANAYFLFISHFAVPSAQLTTSLMS